MLPKISTLDDIKDFAKQLIAEGVSFHPDDDFIDYINFETGLPTYSKAEATFRNQLMEQCFSVCKKNKLDIYQIMNFNMDKNQK